MRKKWQIPFFSIWTGQAFSLLGSKIVQFALIWWLTQLTGSATVLAMASIVGLVPEIALAPLAGVFVDRWNRRAVMIVADGLVALASLGLAYLFWADIVQVWHIYGIIFVRALGGAFHWPAMQASTSLMVPREQLSRVSGMNQTLNGILNIVGAPLGALCLAWLPMAGVMLIDVVTAALAIAPLFFILIPQPPQREETEAKSSFFADLAAGMRYLLAQKGVVILIVAAMVFKLGLTPAVSLIPLLVSEHFGRGAAELALIQSILGVGIVVGGLGLSVWGGFENRILTSLSGMIGLGVAMILVGLIPASTFGLGAVAMGLVGLMIPLIDGPWMAVMQSTIAPEMQGRVLTLIGSLLWITSPIGLSIAGPVADRFGLPIWFIIGGALCGGIGGAMFFVPAVRHIERDGAKLHESAEPKAQPVVEASNLN